MVSNPIVDELFLPSLFAIFTSSLLTVLYVCYCLKLAKDSLRWRIVMTLLLLLSATAFIIQAMKSWKIDFLHQIDLVSNPILWQRVLSGFLMANKLTIDTRENYWITSQLISFVLPLVAYINMHRKQMELPLYVVCAYLGLGLTGSFGGMFALFLYHMYNSETTTSSIQQLTFQEFLLQVISSICGCAAIIFLNGATFAQFKAVSLPIVGAIFVLPFVLSYKSTSTKEKPPTNPERSSYGKYYFMVLGLFITLYHFYLTFLVWSQWLFSLEDYAVLAFGHAYQFAITVDVISCIVILAFFITLKLYPGIITGNSYIPSILKVLVVFPVVLLLVMVISSGGLFTLVLCYREHYFLEQKY